MGSVVAGAGQKEKIKLSMQWTQKGNKRTGQRDADTDMERANE